MKKEESPSDFLRPRMSGLLKKCKRIESGEFPEAWQGDDPTGENSHDKGH